MKQINMLDNNEIERIKELRNIILEANIKYYDEDSPIFSDYEYDRLVQELKSLEKKHKGEIEEFSFNSKIGGTVKSSFEKVNHEVLMQSLRDVFNVSDIEDFLNKIRNSYGEDIEFVVENKIDGLSVSLEYENGVLKRGSTRGNGEVGEDVTENLKCVQGIPLKLGSNDTIEVRGEVYLPRKEFERINKELENEGKKLLANPRNAAAGTLRQLDIDLVKKRKLSIFVFNVQKSDKLFKNHKESLDYINKLGVKTIELCKVCKTNEEVVNYINKIGDLRDGLEYDIDGAVIKVNNLSLRDRIGTTVKVPKWAVAYKYPPEQKETKILDIIYNVGRTGKITPMATLMPVKVAGSVISSVTLHNFDYIKNKDIRIGDVCIIHKAGDVIPEIDKIIKEKRTGNEIEVIVPKCCPVCREELKKDDNIVDIKCINSKCPAMIRRNIIHFVSRDAMNIDGMGESIVDKLIENNKIKDIADIYYLTKEDFLSLENFKDKSSTNLINAIDKTKNNTLDKLIFGLGIDNIGKKGAKVLSNNFDDIYDVINVDFDTLSSLNDFGNIMAKNVIEFFSNDKNIEVIEKLEKAKVNLKGSKIKLDSDKLKDMIFCITGSFDNFKRKDIALLIEKNGGKTSGSVSKKTSYLIAGEDSGSKLKKANDLDVKVITLEEFLKLI